MFRRIAPHALAVVGAIAGLVGIALAQEAAAPQGKDPLLYIASAAAVSLPAIATGYAQAKIGAAGSGALAENRELFVPILALVALPETAVILGFVISILILFL